MLGIFRRIFAALFRKRRRAPDRDAAGGLDVVQAIIESDFDDFLKSLRPEVGPSSPADA